MASKSNYMSDISNLQKNHVISPTAYSEIQYLKAYMSMGLNEVELVELQNLNANFSLSTLTYLFDPFPITLLNPKNNILFLDFAGQVLNFETDNLVIRSKSPVSNTCLKLNSTFMQHAKGAYNGIRIVAFLGSNHFGMYSPKTNFKDLPYSSVAFDKSGSNFSNIYSQPVIFTGGKFTKIGLENRVFERKFKPKGSCDFLADVPGQQPVTRPIFECEIECLIDQMILSDNPCNCYLNYASHRTEFSLARECNFETLTSQNCFDFIQNFKTNKTNICKCGTPCSETDFTTTVTTADNSILGTYDMMRLSQDYDYLLNGQGDFLVRYQNWLSDLLGRYFTGYTANHGDISTGGRKKRLASRKTRAGSSTVQSMPDSSILQTSITAISQSTFKVDYITKIMQVASVTNLQDHHTTANPEFQQTLLKNGISILDIYYENLRLQKITENYEDLFISLFSDIGGQLGLWLGVSIVSWMEVVYFIGFICCGKVVAKYFCRNSNNPGGRSSDVVKIETA